MMTGRPCPVGQRPLYEVLARPLDADVLACECDGFVCSMLPKVLMWRGLLGTQM
jgi:hypothetical protein